MSINLVVAFSDSGNRVSLYLNFCSKCIWWKVYSAPWKIRLRLLYVDNFEVDALFKGEINIAGKVAGPVCKSYGLHSPFFFTIKRRTV